MKKYLFLLVFINALLASCCKTNVDPSQHVNKFTCKVNGVFWEAIPRERDILGNDLQMEKSTFFDVFSLRAANTKKKQSINLDFAFSDTSRTSKLLFKYAFSNYGAACDTYTLDTTATHTATITNHDKIKKEVKGSFAFRAFTSNVGCKDTVTVTDGFFDMHY